MDQNVVYLDENINYALVRMQLIYFLATQNLFSKVIISIAGQA